jgi:hypothetical protein
MEIRSIELEVKGFGVEEIHRIIIGISEVS